MGTSPHWQDDVPAELIFPKATAKDLDAAAPGEVLKGFLDGPIPRDPSVGVPPVWRLYQTEALDRYLEVSQEDVVGAVQLPDGMSLLRVAPAALIRSVATFRAGQGAGAFLGSGFGAAHAGGTAPIGADDTPTAGICRHRSI
jgi:hypothetical protein